MGIEFFVTIYCGQVVNGRNMRRIYRNELFFNISINFFTIWVLTVYFSEKSNQMYKELELNYHPESAHKREIENPEDIS